MPRLSEATVRLRVEAAAIGCPAHGVLAFQRQMAGARQRRIAFEFTLTEWWAWWQTQGRWDLRGSGRGKLVMARLADQGPYRTDNVYCATHAQNITDGAKFRAGGPRKSRQARMFTRFATHRTSVMLEDAQLAWLKAKAGSLGLSANETLRRLLDKARGAL